MPDPELAELARLDLDGSDPAPEEVAEAVERLRDEDASACE